MHFLSLCDFSLFYQLTWQCFHKHPSDFQSSWVVVGHAIPAEVNAVTGQGVWWKTGCRASLLNCKIQLQCHTVSPVLAKHAYSHLQWYLKEEAGIRKCISLHPCLSGKAQDLSPFDQFWFFHILLDVNLGCEGTIHSRGGGVIVFLLRVLHPAYLFACVLYRVTSIAYLNNWFYLLVHLLLGIGTKCSFPNIDFDGRGAVSA